MTLEIRRRASFSAAETSSVSGTSSTNHVNDAYQAILGGSIGSDNFGEQKNIILAGVNSTGIIRVSAVIHFQVTRRSADTPDYSVEEGVADWMNGEDTDIQFKVIDLGDTGWSLQVKDSSANAGVMDWTFTEETILTFPL